MPVAFCFCFTPIKLQFHFITVLYRFRKTLSSEFYLRACSHDPGTTHCPRATHLGVNFASVHGLTSVTVHMSYLLPLGNFERWVTCCATPGKPSLAEVTFLHVNRTQKLSQGKSSFARAHY